MTNDKDACKIPPEFLQAMGENLYDTIHAWMINQDVDAQLVDAFETAMNLITLAESQKMGQASRGTVAIMPGGSVAAGCR